MSRDAIASGHPTFFGAAPLRLIERHIAARVNNFVLEGRYDDTP